MILTYAAYEIFAAMLSFPVKRTPYAVFNTRSKQVIRRHEFFKFG